tara:strand:+ start:5090 stop:5569 length:480 start_codon:yes stop_codon:yes gene_type:complete
MARGDNLTEDQDPRAKREHDTREVSSRPTSWTPPSVLPVPDTQDGYEFRWIRVAMRGNPDNTNVSRKYREGWEPVRLEDHPELRLIPDIDNRFDGMAVIGGLMLCKNSTELMGQKRAYTQEQSDNAMKAVDNDFLRENDARMPLLPPDRRTRVSFGDGS